MKPRYKILIVAVAGILWGLSEIFVGDVFYRFHVPMRGAALTALGMMILVMARLLYNRLGTSIAIALIAGGLRCLVPKLYICHFVAIALEGFAFDIAWTAFRAADSGSPRRMWLASLVGVYSGFFAFGMASIYLFRFGRWVAGGITGTAVWTLRSGSVTSILLIGLVPLAAAVAGRIKRSYAAEIPDFRI